jgi:hypothetical protein
MLMGTINLQIGTKLVMRDWAADWPGEIAEIMKINGDKYYILCDGNFGDWYTEEEIKKYFDEID